MSGMPSLASCEQPKFIRVLNRTSFTRHKQGGVVDLMPMKYISNWRLQRKSSLKIIHHLGRD
jgi:hypothetical protein